jgi:preprotein translocase subunit SecG
VSATTIGRKDVLQIEYIAEDVVMEQFTLPRFNKWKWTVVSGPTLSSTTTQMGRVVKQQTIYSVMLQPNATGLITVPGATALINNKPMRSNVVIVQVKNLDHTGSSKPPVQTPKSSLFDQLPFEDEVPSNQYLKKGEKAIDKIKNNIVVRLEVNKRSCFVGEPILATYKLCTRLRSKSKVIKQPQFSGCTVVELTGDDQEQHIEKINGIEYNVFVIRKVQLVPLAVGPLVLPATSVENRVSFYNASNLSYRDLYYGNAKVPVDEQLVTLQNKLETIDVKPLPPFPFVGNTDFSGGVGSFEMDVTGEGALTTNNTNQLIVTIKGEGNLQQVKPPVINWPKGLEPFEVKEHDEVDKSGFPVKSQKVFAFPFVADKKGSYTIPSAALTYFDPNSKKYVTKNTQSVTLQIAQGSKKIFGTSGIVNDAAAFQNRLYILLGAGFLAIVIGLVWFNGKQKAQPHAAIPIVPKEESWKPVVPQREASEFLYNIRELQPGVDSSFFYKLLCKNLHSYLSSKFNIVPGQLPFYLEQHPEKEVSLLQLKRLLDNCSLGMYTPVFTIEEAMQHRLDAIQVLSQLEKEN